MFRVRTILAASIMTGAALLSSGSSATASLSQCNSNYMCAWGNDDFLWLIAEQYHGQGSWLDPFNAEEDNETDSWANRSATYTGCLAQNANGGGDRITMSKNDNDNNLAFFNADEASSMRTKYGC